MNTYDRRFVWRRWSTVTEATYHEHEQTWDSDTDIRLWGWVEELTATERLMYNAYYGGTDVKIHLNNFVGVRDTDGTLRGVRAKDGLFDTRFGEVYQVTGIERGNNETIALATRAKDVQGIFPANG